jgi:ankyrin repeat protein
LEDGQTALFWAARNGRDEIVANLLEKCADVDANDKVRIDMYVGIGQ